MKTEPLNIWQIDINETYIITDDLLVFNDIQAFEDYYFDDALYDGIIKDNYEQWCETNAEDKGATEISGSEAIAMLHKHEIEMAEYWKKRYYETMGETELNFGDYVVPESPAVALARKYGEKLEGEKK